jgi:biotin carboxylase
VTASTRRVAVVFGSGTAAFHEITAAAQGLADPVFVLDDTPRIAAMRPILSQIGPVVGLELGVERVAGFLAELGVGGITTYRDALQPVTADLAARLGLPYHSPLTARLLTDKHRQRETLRQAGLPSPRARLIRGVQDWPDAVRHVGLPAVVKPVRGEGSRDVYRIDDEARGAELVGSLLGAGAEPCAEGNGMVLEEFLRGRASGRLGDYVSVESAVIGGEVHPIAVSGKFPQTPPFRETGGLWPARLDADEAAEIEELTAAALRALGVTTGVTHTEVKLTDDGPRIIEVNGRIGGLVPELAMRAAGFDLVGLSLRIALGDPVEVPRLRPDRVYYQYWLQAPLVASRVESFDGVAAVRAVPGVTGFRRFAHPGDLVGGGVASNLIGMVVGHADDHDAAEAAVGAVAAGAHVSYAPVSDVPAGHPQDEAVGAIAQRKDFP